MKKVFLVDLKNDYVGHYHIMKCLAGIEGTNEIDTKERKYKFRQAPLRFFIERIRILKRVMNEITQQSKNEDSIVHFITADKFYFLYWLFPGRLKNSHIIATIHRIPQNSILLFAMKRFAARVESIIVLSGYLEKRLVDVGINNVVSLQHPTFYDYKNVKKQEELKAELGVNQNSVVFSYIGGTRYEKGLDILLEALKYLSDDEKKTFCFNIAGSEDYFSKEYIYEKIDGLNINIKCKIKRLSEREFMENVEVSDYVILPYRKKFNSMSGILCESLARRKGCLMPRHGIFNYYNRMLDKEMSFESENPLSLACSIKYCMKRRPAVPVSIEENFQQGTFTRKMRDFYNKF